MAEKSLDERSVDTYGGRAEVIETSLLPLLFGRRCVWQAAKRQRERRHLQLPSKAGRTCKRRKWRHVSGRAGGKRLVDSERQLTCTRL
jgi:hypothetical protein